MGFLPLNLGRNEREIYLISKKVSSVNDIITFRYYRLTNHNSAPSIRLSIEASEDYKITRERIVKKEFGSLENLIEKIKSGETKWE